MDKRFSGVWWIEEMEAWESKRRREQGQELERRKKDARAHAIRAKRDG